MRASWELACRLSEALRGAGEALYALNYRFSTKSLIRGFLIEYKVAFHECLRVYGAVRHVPHSLLAPRAAQYAPLTCKAGAVSLFTPPSLLMTFFFRAASSLSLKLSFIQQPPPPLTPPHPPVSPHMCLRSSFSW